MKRDAYAFDRPGALLHGAHLAKVVSISDPDSRNRVQVQLITCDADGGPDAPLWARVVAPFAGDDRGTFFMPDVEDEVLVVFAGGDARFDNTYYVVRASHLYDMRQGYRTEFGAECAWLGGA